jgi:hypothetical protein
MHFELKCFTCAVVCKRILSNELNTALTVLTLTVDIHCFYMLCLRNFNCSNRRGGGHSQMHFNLKLLHCLYRCCLLLALQPTLHVPLRLCVVAWSSAGVTAVASSLAAAHLYRLAYTTVYFVFADYTSCYFIFVWTTMYTLQFDSAISSPLSISLCKRIQCLYCVNKYAISLLKLHNARCRSETILT